MSTRQLVTIGQRWERNRGKQTWVIRQVWRSDRKVFMVSHESGAEETQTVDFANLRRFYTLLPPTSPDGEMGDAA